jgi:3-dehydroquinate dehydratase II
LKLEAPNPKLPTFAAAMPTISILNGPNLNLLGRREPKLYGTRTFEDYLPELQAAFPGFTLDYFQSNHEGALLDRLHEVGYDHAGIIFNPAGLTHTSVALADAVAAIAAPVVEVHLTNILAREPERRISLLARHCVGSISGFGLESYRLALHWLEKHLSRPTVGFRF